MSDIHEIMAELDEVRDEIEVLKMLIRQTAACAYKSNPELYHKLLAAGRE